jgi:hypothetical protein
LEHAPAHSPLAALYSHPLVARPSLCTIEALRGILGGATITIPGGACTLWQALSHSTCSAHRFLSWGRSYLVYLAPTFDLPRPDAARLPLRGASQNGRAPNLRSPFPSLEVSKHTPSVMKSSIWGRKESSNLGMCSAPLVQSDQSSSRVPSGTTPLPEQPGFSLTSGGGPGPYGPGLIRSTHPPHGPHS